MYKRYREVRYKYKYKYKSNVLLRQKKNARGKSKKEKENKDDANNKRVKKKNTGQTQHSGETTLKTAVTPTAPPSS